LKTDSGGRRVTQDKAQKLPVRTLMPDDCERREKGESFIKKATVPDPVSEPSSGQGDINANFQLEPG
jgi:hypothetical protein